MSRAAVPLLVLALIGLSHCPRACAESPSEKIVPLTAFQPISEGAAKLTDHWTVELHGGAATEAIRSVVPPTALVIVPGTTAGQEPPEVTFSIRPSVRPAPPRFVSDVEVKPAEPGVLLPCLVGGGVAGVILGMGLMWQLGRRG